MTSEHDRGTDAERREQRHQQVEWKLDLGKVTNEIRNQVRNLEDSDLNPARWFEPSVPASDEAEIRANVEQQFRKRGEFLSHLGVYAVINVLLWFLYLSGNDILARIGDGDLSRLLTTFPWPLTVSFGWGAGLAAHWIETRFETGERANRRDRRIRQLLRETHGEAWRETVSKKDYRRTVDRVMKPYKKRTEFLQHLAVFVCINIMLWVLYFGTGGLAVTVDEIIGQALQFPWPMLVFLGWGAGLVAHALDAYAHGAVRVGAQEAAVQRALERERALRDAGDYLEKPKRDTYMRLGDDGELVELIDDEEPEKPKRHGRG